MVFYELGETDSFDQWRLIASPNNETPLIFSSQTWIYDTTISNRNTFELPAFPKENLTALLYVFQGNLKINNDIELVKGESLIVKDEKITFNTLDKTELILFLTDENAEYYQGGAFSGNQLR